MMITLRERVTERRQTLGISQSLLAELLGIPLPQMQRYEEGSSTLPLQMIVSLATVLKTSVEYLLGVTDIPDAVVYLLSTQDGVIAKRIREHRHEMDLSLLAIARRSGVTGKQLTRYESDESEPSPEILVRLATALETSVSYLLGLTPYSHPLDYRGKYRRASLGMIEANETEAGGNNVASCS